MTKSAIQFKQLEEAERHNREEEKLGKTRNTISLITGLASAASRPLGTLIGKGFDMKMFKDKPVEELKRDPKVEELFNKLMDAKQSGKRLSNDDYYIFKTLLPVFGRKE